MLKRELEHDVTDLFLAKCAATMPVDEAAKGRIFDLIARLLKAASPDARPHTGV